MSRSGFNLRLGHLIFIASIATGVLSACSEARQAVEPIEGFSCS
jgi:hypothetical protein